MLFLCLISVAHLLQAQITICVKRIEVLSHKASTLLKIFDSWQLVFQGSWSIQFVQISQTWMDFFLAMLCHYWNLLTKQKFCVTVQCEQLIIFHKLLLIKELTRLRGRGDRSVLQLFFPCIAWNRLILQSYCKRCQCNDNSKHWHCCLCEK